MHKIGFAAFLIAAMLAPAFAQAPGGGRGTVKLPCGAGLVQLRPARALRVPVNAMNEGQLRIDYAGHSTFVITSARGVTVATDYNDNHRAPIVPDIVTMSGWHPNHATLNIPLGVTHALRGWHMGNGGISHDVSLKDTRVYSVAVNINGGGTVYQWPSSVFVIQSSGLCVAHLGLLAHALHPDTVKQIGKIDVLMTPVDGYVTQTLDEIFHNIRLIDPKVVIPMHYDRRETVEEFLSQAQRVMPVRRAGASGFVVDKSTLPKSTEVYYLVPPQFGTTL